ncbi:predicted protein [Botrytis cinerea T4]|uniref:Uncharacterized protein n=1 Tax=Botryotinia fuckeliana (strain T4) TaxID=999810 RepID=G2XND9_BOTF4|nr:predicted protein [Botrytis cinerea T4]
MVKGYSIGYQTANQHDDGDDDDDNYRNHISAFCICICICIHIEHSDYFLSIIASFSPHTFGSSFLALGIYSDTLSAGEGPIEAGIA